jgi:hypothetical protein
MVNPLFYRNVVPLNRDAHRSLRIKAPEKPLEYARSAHLIPAMIDEFGAMTNEIPLAFLPGAAQPAAVFVTGIKPGRNAFITEAGRWDGSYVPAYIRRYPFIIGDVADADPVLCIDDSYEGLGQKEGARLFSAAGKPEAPIAEGLKIANQYRAAAARTDAFTAMLQKLRLFRSISLDAKLADGETTIVHGLLIVDEQILAALPDSDFLDLRKAGYLKPIYAHLQSLGAVSKLGAKASSTVRPGDASGSDAASTVAAN